MKQLDIKKLINKNKSSVCKRFCLKSIPLEGSTIERVLYKQKNYILLQSKLRR